MSENRDRRLPESVAREVLARAAELDASDQMSISIPDLRTAAIEAGISPSALDRVLNEIEDAESAIAGNRAAEKHAGSQWKRRVLLVVTAALVVLGATYALRRMAPRDEPQAPPTIETPPLESPTPLPPAPPPPPPR